MRALFSLALLVASLFAVGCKTALPVEPYLYAPPNLFAGSDTNVTVLIAQGEVATGVRLLPASEASLHVLGPVQAQAGKMLVYRRSPEKVNLVLDKGTPLPGWTRHLFTSTEAAGLGLTFSDAVTPPPTAFRTGPPSGALTVALEASDPEWVREAKLTVRAQRARSQPLLR